MVSWVWSHYNKTRDRQKIRCDHCRKEYSDKTSTASMADHLKKQHKLKPPESSSNASIPLPVVAVSDEVEIVQETSNDANEPEAKKSKLSDENSKVFETVKKKTVQPTIAKSFQPSLESRFAKMASVDGFSYHAIAKSEFIQEATVAMGYKRKITDEKTVAAKVSKFADDIRQELKEVLGEKIKLNVRFSITTDEFTSGKNSRYLTVNLHEGKEHHNLGMVHATGSLNAENIKKLIEIRLKEYDLDMKVHIVALSTDGASVMLKLGTLVDPFQQVCHSHGMHLGVCDTMYTKKNKGIIDLTKNLDEAIFEAKLHVEDEEFTNDQKSLLYFLAKNVSPSIKSHLPLLAKYVVKNKLDSEDKIQFAIDLLTKNERKKKFDLSKFEDLDKFEKDLSDYDELDQEETIDKADLKEFLEEDDTVEEMEKRMEFFDKIDKKDLDLDFELHELMDIVRKTARFFRKSSLKNDNLQIEVTKEIGKESKLLLDMKVRWNSMLFMLKSFVKVETPLLKGECVLIL